MEKHTTYFYRPVKNMLWGGVQIYDFENPFMNLLHKIYSSFLLGIFAYGYIITEVIHVFNHINELEELTLTLCYLIAHIIGIGKVIVLTIKRKSIGKFITSLEHGAFLPNAERGGNEEQTIVNYAVARTNNQAKVFGMAVVSMISSRIIQVSRHTKLKFFDEETNSTIVQRVFPYPSTLPFPVNYDEKSVGYAFEFVYETFAITLFGWYLGNSDTIITGLMIHVTAQFKIVTHALLTVTERAERLTKIAPFIIKPDYNSASYGEKELPPEIANRLNENLTLCVKDCIKHHYQILELLDNMENTFSELLLIQFLSSLTSLCVGLYQTSLLPITNPSFVSMSSFTLAMTFQLLIYCWNGNELSLYSVKVADAAFDCRWINASRDIKLSLMLITQRAQRLSYLTAGKFSKISLETFTAILRGSVSYFMVLRKVHEDEGNNII